MERQSHKKVNTYSKEQEVKKVSENKDERTENRSRSICRIFQLIIPKEPENRNNELIRQTCHSLTAIRNQPINPVHQVISPEIMSQNQRTSNQNLVSLSNLPRPENNILRDYILKRQKTTYIATRSIEKLKDYWSKHNNKVPMVFKKQKLLTIPLTTETFIEEEFTFLRQ